MDYLPNLNATRLLLVEGDPDVMDRLSGTLETAGYSVHRAYNAGDAIYLLENGRFDLALIDARMGDSQNRAMVDLLVDFPWVRWIALVDERYAHPESLAERGALGWVSHAAKTVHLLRQIEAVLDGEPPPDARSSAGHDDRQRDEFSALLERRLIEQQTLSNLARSLSAVLDLDVLLTQVVDAAVRLSNAEEGLLLLPDDEGKALYVRAVKGIDSETARNFRIKTRDTLAGQVFRQGQPILVGDQGPQKLKTEYLVKSLLYVPMSIKGETIGVLGVNNKSADRTFTEHDSELLQDLAAHAAVAIENARLYEESVLRTRELSTLVQAGEAANSTLAIDRVLSIIAGQLIAALDVAQCYIGEGRPHHDHLQTLAVRSRALWRPGEGPVLSAANHPGIEQSFKQQRIAILTPARSYVGQPPAAWLPHRYLARHVVHVPLFTQDHPLAVVILYYIHRPFDDARDSRAVQAQVQQLALETVITLSGRDARQHQKTLFRVAQRIIDASRSDWCEIALWDSTERRFVLSLSYGEAIWREEPRPGLDLEHFPQLAQVLAEQVPLTEPPADELRYLTELGHGKSLLGLPLVIKGQAEGLVLLVDTRADRHFARREVELAQALVLQAANALGNARLYRDLEISLEELHRTQSKLVQTARLSAMGELAAAVAHQINNPLTTILGDTEMLLQDLPPDREDAEALEAIFRAGKRAHEVVRRLLGMARQQSAEESLQPLDVNETITNTLTLVRGHIQHGSVGLAVDLAEDLPPVAGIIGQLEDVWLNLLLNARDAVANLPDARIGIASAYRPDVASVEVRVWDNGIGIEDEVRAQIFEPFFTTKPTGEGTGLGLHICQQIVEKCQGSICVESTYNEGTEFIVQLPIYSGRNES